MVKLLSTVRYDRYTNNSGWIDTIRLVRVSLWCQTAGSGRDTAGGGGGVQSAASLLSELRGRGRGLPAGEDGNCGCFTESGVGTGECTGVRPDFPAPASGAGRSHGSHEIY